MSNFLDERRYAWRMIARRVGPGPPRRASTASRRAAGDHRLLDAALDAGLDRSELIVELANLGPASSICDPDTATKYELTA